MSEKPQKKLEYWRSGIMRKDLRFLNNRFSMTIQIGKRKDKINEN
jgi:hypothetical protein